MSDGHLVVEWIKERIQITNFDISLWNDAHTRTALDFVSDSSIKTLFVCCSIDGPSYSLLVSLSPPKPSEGRIDVAYFIRGEGNTVNLTNVNDTLIFGTVMLRQTATTVMSKMENEFYPIIFDDSGVSNQSSRIELLGLYHRFMAALTETSNEEQDRTTLYLPTQDSRVDYSEKAVIQQLESIAIHWMREIKSILNNHVNSMAAGKLVGPIEELSFWKSRAIDLSNILCQLKSSEVKYVISTLNEAKSKYVQSFEHLTLQIEQGSSEAQNCVKFLEILRDPCQQLSTLTADQIPSLFPQFLNSVRAIYSLSSSYNSSERISGLLRRISSEIIRKSSSYLSLHELFNGDVYKAVKALKECIQCGTQWKNLYNRTAVTINNQSSSVLWKLNDDMFAEINGFVQRCDDLMELCEGRIQFVFMLDRLKDEPSFEGTNGVEIEHALQGISASFKTQISRLSTLTYNVLDARTFQWHEDFNTFKLVVKDLDDMFINTIHRAFEPVKELKIAVSLLQSFRDISRRHVIRLCLVKKATDVCQMFVKDCQLIRIEFDDYHRNPPLRRDEPRYAGPALWAESLKKDIERKWSIVESAVKNDIPAEVMTEAEEKKINLMDALHSYQRQKYQDWMAVTSASIDSNELRYRLDEPLLRRCHSTEANERYRVPIDTNFDSDLSDIFIETQYWEKLHSEEYEIPNVIMAMCHQREMLRVVRERVIMLVRDFNSLIEELTETNNLYADHLKYLERKMSPGFTRLLWSCRPAVIERYVQASINHIQSMHREVTSFKAGMKVIERNFTVLATTPLIEIDKNREYSNFEFAIQQAERRDLSKKTMLESYEVIRNETSILYKQFEGKSTEVCREWEQLINRIDISILESLRRCLVTSLGNLTKAMGCEHPSSSGGNSQGLLSTSVVLKNGQVQCCPSMIDVTIRMNAVAKDTIAIVKSFQGLTDKSASSSDNVSTHCFFYEKISSDPLVLDKVVQIMNKTASNAIEVKKSLLHWDQYKSLWEMDKESFIRRYRKTNQSLESFDRDISAFKQRSEEISRANNQSLVRFILLNFKTLKSALIAHSDEFVEKLSSLQATMKPDGRDIS